MKEYCRVEDSRARVMMASLNRYFINYYKREERESHITWVGVEEWVWGWGWFLIINNKMA